MLDDDLSPWVVTSQCSSLDLRILVPGSEIDYAMNLYRLFVVIYLVA